MQWILKFLGFIALFASLYVQCDILPLGKRCQHHPLSPLVPNLVGGITKVIHQSWKSHKLLPHQAQWQESWKEKHPQWLYRLWTDTENHKLVQESLPWLLPTYESMPKEIYRADLVRYVYMYIYGGVYIDLDFECLKPLDELLHNKSIALAYDIRDDNGGAEIANAFMASTPGHPFWIHVLTNIVKAAGSTDVVFDAVMLTGPGAISQAFKDFATVEGLPIYVAPAGMIYPTLDPDLRPDPCRYQGAAFDAAACKARHLDAIAITYWTGSWQ